LIQQEQIDHIVKEVIRGTELFLVDLSINNNLIKIILDSDMGVAIKDCVQVSRYIESKLDRDVNDFSLEVTSAGINQPFKIMRQYEKHLGKQVEVIDISGTKWNGVLVEANEKTIKIRESKLPKGNSNNKSLNSTDNNSAIIKMSLNNIKQTRAALSFKHN